MGFLTKCMLTILFYLISVNSEPLRASENENEIDADVSGKHALENFLIVDGHNDLAMNINRLYKNQLKLFDFKQNVEDSAGFEKCGGFCHTDLPKLRAGKVGAQFWSAYIDCRLPNKEPVALTVEQIDVIKRLARKYSDDLMFATNADDIEKAFKQNKIASFIGVEGGHSIGNQLSVLRAFYELGVRYMTLTHVCTLDWADSSTVDTYPNIPKTNLTDFGKTIVREMNRLGMMVDLSHVSKGVMLDALTTSRAPVIFSHSSSRHVYDHTRNVDDDVLVKLKNNEGIIMVNFVPSFVSSLGVNGTISNVVNHIEHIADIIGTDYIGFGGDFDGIPQTIKGLENVSKYPDIFNQLRITNPTRWTIPNLEKLAGRNLVRVMKLVEKVRDELVNEEPYEDILEKDFEVIPVFF